MKTLNSFYTASILIFMTGLVLKLFRTPFHTISMLLGLGILLIVSIAYFIALQQNKGLLGLTTFFAGAYILSIIKFWPHMVFATFLGFIMILTVIVCGKAILNHKLRTTIIALMIVMSISLLLVPQHQRYYLFNIKFNYHVESDYFAWDKYSWFLYKSEMMNEAIEANHRATEIVIKSDNQDMIDLIARHKNALEENSWKNYR